MVLSNAKPYTQLPAAAATALDVVCWSLDSLLPVLSEFLFLLLGIRTHGNIRTHALTRGKTESGGHPDANLIAISPVW